jgi:hypothetical protein
MAKTQNDGKSTGFTENQVIVTAKRALGLNKFYVAIAIVIGIGVLLFLNPTYVNLSKYSNSSVNQSVNVSAITSNQTGANSKMGLPLLAVPFSVLPMMMLTTPMVILFVYDKNNGVLEYLISLGMTQRSIYKRYLKAALLVAASYLLIFGTLNLLYSFAQFGTTYLSTMLMILGIGAIIAVSTVAFIMTMMMIFSSLQKARNGGNQPLALTLGLVGVLPGYFIPFIFAYNTAIVAEIIQGGIIAAVALILFLLSPGLIKREKFLP